VVFVDDAHMMARSVFYIEEIRNDVALSGELATGGQPSEEHVQELAQAGFECMINRVHSLFFS
jgi:hypothetical protein